MRHHCDHENCGRSYARREHLLRHLKDHEDLRPFQCRRCQATFNRRDMLNRHVSLSHGTPRVVQDRDSPMADRGHPEPTAANQTAGVTEAGGIGPELAKPANGKHHIDPHRRLVEEAYFRHFHSSWPILHRDTFQNAPQPTELVEAVLVAGLFFMSTPDTLPDVKRRHSMILVALGRRLQCMTENNYPQEPSSGNLACLQAMVIPHILTIYRESGYFMPAVANCKRLFQVYQQAGVYDQRRIDAASSDPIVREQYQRLGLFHLKLRLHLNVESSHYFTRPKLPDYLRPQCLHVRIPSPRELWDAKNYAVRSSSENPTHISDIFSDSPKKQNPEKLSAIVACDFTVGMALGCFLSKGADESHHSLTLRTRPFLSHEIQNLKISGDLSAAPSLIPEA